MKWVYDKSTGKFLYGGAFEPAFDAATQAVLELDQHPDVVKERVSAGVVRPATQEEIDAHDAALATEYAEREASLKPMRVLAYWLLKRTLGRNPTLAEINAAKAEIVAIWKALA